VLRLGEGGYGPTGGPANCDFETAQDLSQDHSLITAYNFLGHSGLGSGEQNSLLGQK